MIVVLDCSAVVPWLFEEDHEPFVDSLYREYRHGRVTAAAPLLLRSEVANVAWKKVRQGRARPEDAIRLIYDFSMLPIDYAASGHILEPALRIALDTGVTVYDAHYLAMARAKCAALASQDRRVVLAARELGISLYPESKTPAAGRCNRGEARP